MIPTIPSQLMYRMTFLLKVDPVSPLVPAPSIRHTVPFVRHGHTIAEIISTIEN